MTTGSGDNDKKTARLLELVMCLLAAKNGIDRATLRASISGYDSQASDAAFQRTFERDKDDLRKMGMPVETMTDAGGQVIGYCIPRDDFQLPEITLTAEQWLMLNLAARMWSEATLGRGAQSALRKFEAARTDRARVDGLDESSLEFRLDLQARSSLGDSSLPIFYDAIRTRTEVRFDYRGLHNSTSVPRRLYAWGVLGRWGGWYVVGHDLDRDDVRVFRTSRISNTPKKVGAAGVYTIPDVSISDLVSSHKAQLERGVAQVLVRPGVGGRLRLQTLDTTDALLPSDVQDLPTPTGWDRLRIEYRSIEEAAAQIASLGDSVRVEHPPALSAVVRERWAAALALHQDVATEAEA